MSLKNKTAVLTGATGALMGEVARALARAGVNIAVLSRSEAKAAPLLAELAHTGVKAKAYECDIMSKTSLLAAEEQIYRDFGQYHILINGAGGNLPGAITSGEYYDEKDKVSFFGLDANAVLDVFNLNFMGTFLPTQIFAKKLISAPGGCIINVSSVAAVNSFTKVGPYSAAKAAVDSFTKWCAVHFARTGLRVNAIAPGVFMAEQNKTLLTNPDGSLTPRSAKIAAATPMQRLCNTADFAGAFLWLADEEKSGFVTGQIICVDGGFSANSGV